MCYTGKCSFENNRGECTVVEPGIGCLANNADFDDEETVEIDEEEVSGE